jgi:hypothetical protein
MRVAHTASFFYENSNRTIAGLFSIAFFLYKFNSDDSVNNFSIALFISSIKDE